MFRRLTTMLGHHIREREETAVLGVGRDLWMLALGAVLLLTDYWMHVNIEINRLPYLIIFVQ